jgi:hypothetical protein
MRKLALLVLCCLTLAVHGQTPASPQPAIRYHFGDNFEWADPAFDDSSWPIAENGLVPSRSRDADRFLWVRIRVPVPGNLNGPLALHLDRIHADGAVTLANAGHLAPYHNGEEIPLSSSLPLGIIVDAEYTETSLRLTPGDTFTFFSDGVVEAQSPTGELFGFERTGSISRKSAQEIADVAQAFGQEDDITVLTLQFAPA